MILVFEGLTHGLESLFEAVVTVLLERRQVFQTHPGTEHLAKRLTVNHVSVNKLALKYQDTLVIIVDKNRVNLLIVGAVRDRLPCFNR